ncbi:hypothetical protein E1A91_D07G241000v1 [Gossypium mustelinum]|uniref:Uncharacterized protein n=1 Tax=Gossypium mustelinum TaxID=34275 RepID=A0A5D2UEH4_GOSMU|nr:hypothetical protein E1A91_D07G241000v1 [Gossypium mustelinum]
MLQSSNGESISQTTQGVFKTIVIECEKPMKQGVLTPGRVRLLLHRGMWTLKYFSKGTLVGTWTHQITSLFLVAHVENIISFIKFIHL